MKQNPIKWVRNILGKIFDWIKPKAKDAISIVNFLKNIVESDVAGVLVGFTKTKADDIALAYLRAHLPSILEKMELSYLFASTNNVDEIIEKFVAYLKEKGKYEKGVNYREVGAFLLEALADDGKIDHDEALAIITAWYKKSQTDGNA